MFKRANKITSLLIAVAAVVSVMPQGANAASSGKIKSQKGQIYNAIAYKDGKVYITGQPSSKDDAAYYYSDGKYNKLDDIGSEDKAEVYGSKYAEIEDGDYYLDLSTGKVNDDKLKEKEVDDVAVNLRNKIKADNDGRYDADDVKEVKNLTELSKSKFADTWYSAEYKIKTVDSAVNDGAANFNVYTSKDGKYIDADYNIGKIKVKLSNGKIANLENTEDKDENVRASVKDANVVAQDNNNIYRIATITVKSSDSNATIKEVNGIALTDSTTAYTLSADKLSASFSVIQVISKAQASKDIDGIKYARTVNSYVLSDKDGKKEDLLSSEAKNFTVADQKLINYKVDSDNITAEVVGLKYKSSYYYVETSNDDHIKLQDGENSVDVDVDGNLWALSGDNIYKFDNDQDFEKTYEVDKEYSNLSVYDKENLVVWNGNDEIYSIVAKNKQTTDEDTNATTDNTTANNNTTTNNTNANTNATANTTVAAKGSWGKDAIGNWVYNNSDGTKYKGWLNENGIWYYLDTNDGVLATGWKAIGDKWYYLQPSGAMKTGWLNDNGIWYYLNTSGEMLSNTFVDGFKLGPSGAWIK